MQWANKSMRQVWVFFCLLVSLSYAIPTEVEIASILSQPAVSSAHSTTLFTVTVSDSIFEEFPELIGRSYTISVEKEADAFLVHTDGYVLSDSSIADQSLVQERIYENVQEQLLKDMGRIEHVREFGIEPGYAELDSYYSYSLAKYGGTEALTSWLLEKYLEGKLSVSVLSQQFQVTNGELTKDATLIENEEIALLKIEGTDFPSVELSPADSDSSGDTVYVISLDEELSEPNIQASISEISGANNEEIDTTAQTENSYLVINSKGKVLGLGFSDSKSEVLSSHKLENLFERNGIQEKDSVVNGIYKEGVNAYFNEDYKTAEQKFKETLVHYPNHAGALENLKLSEDELSNKDFISNLFSSLLKFLSSLSQLQIGLILFAVLLLLIILIKRK